MLHRSSAAIALQINLDEMTRRQDIEALRIHLKNEMCFALTKNSETANITMDELKKLARVWKLNERRNFWKNHSTMEAMVEVLLQHIKENNKINNNNKDNDSNTPTTATTSNGMSDITSGISNTTIINGSPTPPGTLRRSSVSSPVKNGVYTSKALPSSPTPQKITNYCGRPYYSREITAHELVQKSRDPKLSTDVISMITFWRGEDFHLKLALPPSNKSRRKASLQFNPDDLIANSEFMTLQEKIAKHCVLASHLVNYSQMSDEDKNHIPVESLVSFLTVAETHNWIVACHCMVAFSNISSSSAVRLKLLELNGLLRMSALLPLIQLSTPTLASALLMYYYSCEAEIEDRIYDPGAVLFQSNLLSGNDTLVFITLFTLCNLLPAIDRIRITESLTSTIKNVLIKCEDDMDDVIADALLTVLLNMSTFTAIHMTMFTFDNLTIIAKLAAYAESNEQHHIAVAVKLCKYMHSFLFSYESCHHYLSVDYVRVMCDLLEVQDADVIQYISRSLAFMSRAHLLCPNVCDSEVISIVASVTNSRPHDSIPSSAARDLAIYLYNITIGKSSDELFKLMQEGVVDSLLHLIDIGVMHSERSIQSIAVKGLQNLLTSRKVSIKYTALCIPSLLNQVVSSKDCHASITLYNISCERSNIKAMYDTKMHVVLIDVISRNSDVKVKSACINVLVSMSCMPECVGEMMLAGLLKLIKDEVQTSLSKSALTTAIAATTDGSRSVSGSSSSSSGRKRNTAAGRKDSYNSSSMYNSAALSQTQEIWHSISALLLAMVTYKSKYIDASLIDDLLVIMKAICVDVSTKPVIINCSIIMSHLSAVVVTKFVDVDLVVRRIISLSNELTVIEHLSTILFNFSCTSSIAKHLLQDDYYLNVMIRYMRNGNSYVQGNVAKTIRNLCSEPSSIKLLKDELISDLIVIALLRTSSLDIKIICCNAFYNMICHNDNRLRLIQSPFWWGLLRLCKTDADDIRSTCHLVLLHCSVDKSLTQALRDANIFTYINEIVGNGDVLFLELCLCASQNIVNQIDLSTLSKAEVLGLLRLSVDVMTRSSDMQSIRHAIITAYNCILCPIGREAGVADAECIRLDFIHILSRCVDTWSCDCELCVYVTSMILQLTRNQIFTIGSHLKDMNSIFTAAYTNSKCIDVSDSIISIIMQYIIRHSIDPRIIIDLDVFDAIVCDVMGVTPTDKKSFLSAIIQSSFQSNPLHTKFILMSVYRYIAEHIIHFPDRISYELIVKLTQPEYLRNDKTRDNCLGIIQVLSTKCELAQHLINSSVLVTLHAYRLSRLKASQKDMFFASRYCTSIIKNLSFHVQLLPLLLIEDTTGLVQLIKSIVDDETETQSKLNLCYTFYQACKHHGLMLSHACSPSFVLTSLKKIGNVTHNMGDHTGLALNASTSSSSSTSTATATATATTTATAATTSTATTEEVNLLCKHIISLVLEKFSHGIHIDPTFVQAIFLDMQSNTSMRMNKKIPEMMSQETFECVTIPVVYDGEILKVRVFNHALIDATPPAKAAAINDSIWKTITELTLQDVNSCVSSSNSSSTGDSIDTYMKSIASLELELVDPYPYEAYKKIIKTYPNVNDEDEDYHGTEHDVNAGDDSDDSVYGDNDIAGKDSNE